MALGSDQLVSLTTSWLWVRSDAANHSPMGKKFWYETNGKKTRPALPEIFKILFRVRTLLCVEYDDLGNERERNMFQVFSILSLSHLGSLINAPQRVQLGVPLAPAGMGVSGFPGRRMTTLP